jgi:hypothetical protein
MQLSCGVRSPRPLSRIIFLQAAPRAPKESLGSGDDDNTVHLGSSEEKDTSRLGPWGQARYT